MRPIIYFDNNATTPLDTDVFEKMRPYFLELYGNASSTQYILGRKSKEAIELAKRQLASFINCDEEELIFTSGATESITTALQGVFTKYQSVGKHYITCKTEHSAVLENFKRLEKLGAEVTYISVDSEGNIDLNELTNTIRKDTVLVSLMAANNETGTLHPIEKIAEICVEKNVLFFCDATQHIGKLPIDLKQTPIDILCLSGHKFYGPKGIGALYVRKKSKRIQIQPLILGGSQELGYRAGTYNVPGIVGMGYAAELAFKRLATYKNHCEKLRNLLELKLGGLEELSFHGNSSNRLPNVSSIEFRYINAAEIISHSQQFALSMGSACQSEAPNPSHVLLAMGLQADRAKSTLRISLGIQNTEEEILQFVEHLEKLIPKLREKSPHWQLYKAGLWT